MHVGSKRLDQAGYFMEPTILTGTAHNMSVRREEISGPVLSAMSYTDEELDRLAAEANNTNYGLAAHTYTKDLSAAHRLARKIEAGPVSINGAGLNPNVPTGGYRQSGWGRENGLEGVDEYTELKSVAIAP